MFVPHEVSARVNLAVVGLGTPDRLYDALDALVSHDSSHDFTVTCVVNAVTVRPEPPTRPLPDGVLVEYAAGNLGWAGGLHRARTLTDAELLVWVQEDMTPEPGWLDALVAAADAHPQVGGFGAVRVDEGGAVLLHNAGRAEPADQVWSWNDTDRTLEELPAEVTVFDWVTSKGFLTRTRAFDELSGPDPRLWPLNHVDKDYCTHLRCHGWDVALVPQARLQHIGSQASPWGFREFLPTWRDGWFDERWGAAVVALAGSTSARIEHPCAEWRDLAADAVEVAVGLEASRMLVPYARMRAQRDEGVAAQHAAEAAQYATDTAQHAAEMDAAEQRRMSAEAAAQNAEAAHKRAVVRARRRKRRLDAAEARVAELTSRRSGLRAQLRRRFGRLR